MVATKSYMYNTFASKIHVKYSISLNTQLHISLFSFKLSNIIGAFKEKQLLNCVFIIFAFKCLQPQSKLKSRCILSRKMEFSRKIPIHYIKWVSLRTITQHMVARHLNKNMYFRLVVCAYCHVTGHYRVE